MNRRLFLRAALTSLIPIGFAGGWRMGYDDQHGVTIPDGADELCPKLDVPTIGALDTPYASADEAARTIMQAVHRAKPYGVAPSITTVEEFLALKRAHCGDYTVAQDILSNALGLTTRRVRFSNGFHGWVEVQIDGRWQIYDSTTNVWVNQPMDALLQGVPRQYRMFYTPIFDPTAPDIYRAHLKEGWNVPALRARLPYFGLERGVELAALEAF